MKHHDDNPEWTKARIKAAKPLADVLPDLAAASSKRRVGRPKAQETKIPMTFRFDPALANAMRSSGPNFSRRAEKALKKEFSKELA